MVDCSGCFLVNDFFDSCAHPSLFGKFSLKSLSNIILHVYFKLFSITVFLVFLLSLLSTSSSSSICWLPQLCAFAL